MINKQGLLDCVDNNNGYFNNADCMLEFYRTVDVVELSGMFIGAFIVGYCAGLLLLVFKKGIEKST